MKAINYILNQITIFKESYLLKKALILIYTALTSFSASAWEPNPKEISFELIDIQKVSRTIIYDMKRKEAKVSSKIHFYMKKAGHPALLLPTLIQSVVLNEKTPVLDSSVHNFLPAKDTLRKISAIRIRLGKGHHTLDINNIMDPNLNFDFELKAALDTSPKYSRDRKSPTEYNLSHTMWAEDSGKNTYYLDSFMPSNYFSDLYSEKIKINIIGTKVKHTLVSNAKVSALGINRFLVETPSHFNSAAFFIHIKKSSLIKLRNFYWSSSGNRLVKVELASDNLDEDLIALQKRTEVLLSELESDYGPWPHEKLTILGVALEVGGMEYNGGTITGLRLKSVLGHELLHSYFARGVMPAHGRTSWFDESIAYWRDRGYPREDGADLRAAQRPLGVGSRYINYRHGDSVDFMIYLDSLLIDKQGLKGFLRFLIQEKMHQTITNDDFLKLFKTYAPGVEVDWAYKGILYGKLSAIDVISDNFENFSLEYTLPRGSLINKFTSFSNIDFVNIQNLKDLKNIQTKNKVVLLDKSIVRSALAMPMLRIKFRDQPPKLLIEFGDGNTFFYIGKSIDLARLVVPDEIAEFINHKLSFGESLKLNLEL